MWILLAFSGPVLWAISTHIDKYLVERFFKDHDTAVLMAFTSLLGVFLMPFIWWFRPQVLGVPLQAVLAVAASGVLYMGALLFYLQALQTEEASVVAPMFQASTVWGATLAYVFLGERLTLVQGLGGLMVVIAAVLLSLDPSFHFRKMKSRFVLRMLACTLALAVSTLIFKFYAVKDEFWSVTFWTFAGEAVFGIVLLSIPRYLRQFIALLRASTGAVLGINGANELINLGGGLGVRYALLLAPVALVQAISSTSTLFVFLFGAALTVIAPKLGSEDLSAKNVLRKGVAAALVAAGVVVMNA
ncbi:MAG: hypothetical protein RLZZ324_417 [Candidatus Parcubacteria bacterium]|jgi:drug/metabolite transporter (DMT)-like permease